MEKGNDNNQQTFGGGVAVETCSLRLVAVVDVEVLSG